MDQNFSLMQTQVKQAENQASKTTTRNTPFFGESSRSPFFQAKPTGLVQRTVSDSAVPGCTPGAGLRPSAGNCAAYAANSWWLPNAYVNNATCACTETPDSTTANCIRKTLQDKMAATPTSVKSAAKAMKAHDNYFSTDYATKYIPFVIRHITPRVYRDHVDAYRSCCCSAGPAPYSSWVGVTTTPVPLCSMVGASIRLFGSCHGTPGTW